MKRTAVAVAVREAPARSRLLPPIDDELRFDFELDGDTTQPKPLDVGWLREAGGVKAAIVRWLEEQA